MYLIITSREKLQKFKRLPMKETKNKIEKSERNVITDKNYSNCPLEEYCK